MDPLTPKPITKYELYCRKKNEPCRIALSSCTSQMFNVGCRECSESEERKIKQTVVRGVIMDEWNNDYDSIWDKDVLTDQGC